MKKVALTILAFVYLTVSTGATVQLHYCMDRLVGWSLGNTSTDKCGKCGMSKEKHKGCCHDEQKVIKVFNAHKLSETSYSFQKALALNSEQIISTKSILYLQFAETLNPNNHAPPIGLRVPTYIYICVFRI